MNASLLRSLKPGGRLAVLDFRPTSGVTAAPGKRADGDSHGVMPATLIAELTAAGFTDVQIFEEPDHGWICCTGRKPWGPGSMSEPAPA